MRYRGSALGHFCLLRALLVAGEGTISDEVTSDITCTSSPTITAYNFTVIQTEYMYINRTVDTITVTWDPNTNSVSSDASTSVSESSSTSSQTTPTSTDRCASPAFFDFSLSFPAATGPTRDGAFWDNGSLRYNTTYEDSWNQCAQMCFEESECRFWNWENAYSFVSPGRCDRFRDGQQCQLGSNFWVCGRVDRDPVVSVGPSVGSMGDGTSATSTVGSSASSTSEYAAVSSTIDPSIGTENTVAGDSTSAGEFSSATSTRDEASTTTTGDETLSSSTIEEPSTISTSVDTSAPPTTQESTTTDTSPTGDPTSVEGTSASSDTATSEVATGTSGYAPSIEDPPLTIESPTGSEEPPVTSDTPTQSSSETEAPTTIQDPTDTGAPSVTDTTDPTSTPTPSKPPCPYYAYVVISNSYTDTKLYKVDTIYGNRTLIRDFPPYGVINAMGYNHLDGYLYGVQGYTTNSGFEISPRLVRFTEDPTTFEILADIPEFCGKNIGIGDVDDLGHMWIKCQENKWMEYDIPSGDFTNPKSGTTDITPPGVLDWVWMPDDPNALFSISTSPEGVFLWRFDRTDHTWDKVGNDAGYAGPPFPSNGQINAMYGSRLGYIYAREATEGQTYRFSVRNTTLAQLVIGDTQERQTDGARCVSG